MSSRRGLVKYGVSEFLIYACTTRQTYSRIKEKLQSGELSVPGDQWPVFLYHGYTYNSEDPWNGLFRSTLIIFVSVSHPSMRKLLTNFQGV
jgi:hypothetical protein